MPIPQVPAPGGGKRDRHRTKSGRWHKKRSDTGKTHNTKSK